MPDRLGLLRDRVSSEDAPSMKASPCSAICRRTSGTAPRSTSHTNAVLSNRGVDVVRKLLFRVLNKSPVRSPTLAIALQVIPLKIGTLDFTFTRWPGRIYT